MRYMTTRQIQKDYKAAKARLLMLDYDGTLADFKLRPNEAKPDAQLLDILRRLADDPANTVVIISGRDKDSLGEWLGGLPVALISEHGLFFKNPGQPWQESFQLDPEWKIPVKQAMDKSVSAINGSFVEEKAGSLVWHFRAAERQAALAEVQHLLDRLKTPAEQFSLTLLRGHKNVEAKLSHTNKGAAALPWLEEKPRDFILAAGDDTTDEDLFAAMPPTAHTIKIGPGQTAARTRIPSVSSFRTILKTLTKPAKT